ncbi:MAG: hypothetical protein Q9191_002149 [Dirinaria sp. TL-2023a]
MQHQLPLCLAAAIPMSMDTQHGSVTSPGNPYIVTIQITNPTQSTISILAWNNVSDNTTRLPVLFDVKDDLGNGVPVASTYAMRAGLSSSDLYPLAAGQTYYRTVDLRQIMQNLPSGPSMPSGAGLAPKVFTIAPPLSVKGVAGDASAVVEALAALTASPPTLGDMATSNLQDITVASTPTRFSAVFPILGDIRPSFMSSGDGAHVDSDCTAQSLTQMSDGLFDAGVYARSLAMAANSSSNPLFPLFFPESAREKVLDIATAAANSVHGQGPHVDLYCTNIQNLCGNPNILGYSFTPSFLGNAYIVLCPSARALGRAQLPCQTDSLSSATTSHILIHLVLTLNNVVKSVMTESLHGPVACQRLSNSSLADPTSNPDSFAQLATTQWGYGFGGLPYNGPSCLPAGSIKLDVHSRAVSVRHGKTLSEAKSPSRRGLSLSDKDFQTQIALTQDCAGSEFSMLEIAIANAQALAKYASSDLGSKSASSKARWTTGSDGVSIRVVPFYSRRGGDFSLFIICPEYFYNPIALECINPTHVPFKLQQLASDQGGSMLHELLHVTTLSHLQPQISDGSPACYEWNCMTQNAHDRELPGFPAEKLPENVASNYEYFAYSARASRSDCSWTEYAGNVWGSIVALHWVVAGQLAG